MCTPETCQKAAKLVEPGANAGVTWWIEAVDPWRFGYSFEQPWPAEATDLIRECIWQGPRRKVVRLPL